jgi:toxin ParE1/3/4
MATLRFSAGAENDLLEAWLYVAEDSISVADQMLYQIDAEARKLLDQPLMGATGTRPAQLVNVYAIHLVLLS